MPKSSDNRSSIGVNSADERGLMCFFDNGVTVFQLHSSQILALQAISAGQLIIKANGEQVKQLPVQAGDHAFVLPELLAFPDPLPEVKVLSFEFTAGDETAQYTCKVVPSYMHAYSDWRERDRKQSEQREARQKGLHEVVRYAHMRLSDHAERRCWLEPMDKGARELRALAAKLLAVNEYDPKTAEILAALFEPEAHGLLSSLNPYWFLKVALTAAQQQIQKNVHLQVPIKLESVQAACLALFSSGGKYRDWLADDTQSESEKDTVSAVLQFEAGVLLLSQSAGGDAPELVENAAFSTARALSSKN